MKKEKYSLTDILKMRGIGSARVLSLNSKEITSIKDNRLFANFMLQPNYLVIIQKQKTFELPSSDISQILFTQRKIKVRTRFRYKIVFDSIIEIHTHNNKSLKYYSTVQSFTSVKKFFTKDWLANKVIFKESDKVITDNNSYLLNSVLDILELF